jgi:hypothetical protein
MTRFIFYALALSYFLFTGYFDLLVKPACTCQIAEIPRRAFEKAFDQEKGISPVGTLADLNARWREEKFSPRVYSFTLKGKPVKGWTIILPGSQPQQRPIVFATDQENREGLTALGTLTRAFKNTPHGSPLLFAVLDFQPSDALGEKKNPFNLSSPILFLDTLTENNRKVLPSVYRRYIPSDSKEPTVIGDYASRHIVKLAAGFFNRFSARSVSCFRKFPLVPEVVSPHSAWFSDTGLTTAFFYGGLSQGTGNLAAYTRAWYYTLLSFSNA